MMAKAELIITDMISARTAIFKVVNNEVKSRKALLKMALMIIEGGGNKYHFKFNKWKEISQIKNIIIITNKE